MVLLEIIKKNKELFEQYNKAKYDQFQTLIYSPNIRKIINAIPLLLCANHQKLPGYVPGNVPLGIEGYIPPKEEIKYLTNRYNVPTVDFTVKRPFIEMMAVMGSVGTIAYTKKSDFDYWVCVDKRGIADELLQNFQKKVDAIQKWAMEEEDIEVHLFINDIISIKNNIFAEDEDEAFGSTIGAVLKDEFFRSSIIIAGKIPFWWVIPKFINDSEYERLLSHLPDHERYHSFVDLGNLFEISKEDFLGAALFQLIKSLGNPFKSIIKIGVLEKYLFSPNEVPLLSQKVKQNILRGNLCNTILDSYVLMFEEVYDFYAAHLIEKQLLSILRQNFYLKIDPQLSKYKELLKQKKVSKIPYSVQVMFKYVTGWGWSEAKIKDLDDFDNWDYSKLMVFWNQVKKFMLLSFQKISTELPALNLKNKVSDSDFKLLKRKITTHFSLKPGKIDHYVTFKDTPHEAILYLEPVTGDIHEQEWKIFKRNKKNEDEFVSTLLKTEPSLVRLITWVVLNKIYNPTFSRIKIKSGYSRVDQNQVTNLMSGIFNLFVKKNIKLKNDFFLHGDFALRNMLVVNFNLENTEAIKTLHHIYYTSWGESFVKEYSTVDDLIKVLGMVLNDGLKHHGAYEDYCTIITPEPYKKFYKEIENLFRESYNFIVKTSESVCHRFISKVDSTYIVISKQNDKVAITSFQNIIKMLSTMALNPRKDVLYSFHGEDSRVYLLKNIYNNREDNSISIVYEESKDFILVYIVNEKGNLFTFVRSRSLKEEIMINLYGFCKIIVQNVNKTSFLPVKDTVSIKKLQMNKFGEYSFQDETRIVEEIYLIKYSAKRFLQAQVMKYQNPDTMYNIRFPDNSVSDYLTLTQLIQRPDLFKRFNGLHGLFDQINFDDLQDNDFSIGSTIYFFEKYRLEHMTHKCLQ